MPSLSGSYFGNTLTYVCEHNADGAMGIIVNRPSRVSLVELISQLGIDKGETPVEAVVFEGGPVSGERGFILHTDDVTFEASLAIENGVMLSSAREVLEAIADGRGPERYVVALGYAGWDGGQLEDEVSENAWLTCPADPEIIFDTPFEDRVRQAALGLGIDIALISGEAGHA
jgi:putative transcriptional regulator